MPRIEVTEEGLAAINRRIDLIQDQALRGLVEPVKATSCLRSIRTDIYALRESMNSVLVIVPDRAEKVRGNGPDVA